VFDQHGVCVSGGARYDSVNSASTDSTAAMLVAAYRINPNVRVGAYVDNSGVSVRVSAAYGQQNAIIKRQTINDTDPGQGASTLTGQGVQLLTSYGIKWGNQTLVSPYVGLRYTQGESSVYTKSVSDQVKAALFYSGVRTEFATLLAGVAASHQLGHGWAVLASAGIESDLNNLDTTLTVSGLNGLASINNSGNAVKNRPTFSAGLSYDITKSQRVSLNYIYRQSVYEGINTRAAFLSYSFGF